MKTIRTKTLLIAFAICFSASAHTINLDTSLCAAGQQVQIVKTGIQNPEGPVCDSVNNLYFADFAGFDTTKGAIWKVTPAGAAAPFKQNLKVPCGIKVDRQNHLIYGGAHGLWQLDLQSANSTTLASGDSLLEANDLTLTAQGGIFFTSNKWDSVGFIYYRAPAGTLIKKLIFPVSDKSFPNGIVFLEEKSFMYIGLSQKVSGGKTGLVRKYSVDNQMNIANPLTFVSISGPDGMAVDVRYNVWIADGEGGIAVFDSLGKGLGTITMDAGSASNCCFGGPDMQTLYITSGAGVYSVRLKVKGRKTTGDLPVGVFSISKKPHQVMLPADATKVTVVNAMPGSSPAATGKTISLRGEIAPALAGGVRIRRRN
jgi:sugar lactone lactonase YvrE